MFVSNKYGNKRIKSVYVMEAGKGDLYGKPYSRAAQLQVSGNSTCACNVFICS